MSRFDQPHDNNWHQHPGAPSFITPSQSLNLSGFEDFSALSNPAVFEASSPSSQHQIHHNHRPQGVDYFSGYTRPVSQHPIVSDPLHPAHLDNQHAYYSESSREFRSPQVPVSPGLLPANALNFPPLYSADQSLVSPTTITSPNAGYNIPAPPDVPYAESAASSTYSLPEEDEILQQPGEDEKRKRNLAASARFRQKKKLREQQLEKVTRDLTQRADELEARILELEQENDFLKAMLTEKVDTMTEEDRIRFDEAASRFEN